MKPNTEPARDACLEALADLVEWFDAKSDQTGAEALMSLHLRIGRARDALAARGETTYCNCIGRMEGDKVIHDPSCPRGVSA